MPSDQPDLPVTDLPVIDLSAVEHEPRQFRADLRAAAHDVGFFQLVGHGVPVADADRLLELSRAFFALPEAERLALSNLNSPAGSATGGTSWTSAVSARPGSSARWSRPTGGWKAPISGLSRCRNCG
jgi:isopenicillin N synthase-like dioxygenase